MIIIAAEACRQPDTAADLAVSHRRFFREIKQLSELQGKNMIMHGMMGGHPSDFVGTVRCYDSHGGHSCFLTCAPPFRIGGSRFAGLNACRLCCAQVPLWLRLEQNHIDDAENVFRRLQAVVLGTGVMMGSTSTGPWEVPESVCKQT